MSLNLPPRPARPRAEAALAIINIVLLLVFFFLLSGQNRPVPAGIILPETVALPAGTLPPLTLELHGGGEWRIEGQAIAPELLGAALPPGDAPVHLATDRDLPAGELMQALRSPELAGRQIRLVTQRGQAGE
ncbi:MAG: biopolymer transporter ExbD [Paracoccus sp. (in: a-proteobacteria)]|uniref:ExbD/TolR family protein n=1 Tax=Paracoccus sp. TaxID=267 RepID=UPI0026E0868C|nr:biopolymer transporter ExbD [Paracoccus sp. (in: a-proteobacteria)]MDO5622833.1 biopolymer transporter ExbD [Paracoccus sp. (in: a-proteobacteria)]